MQESSNEQILLDHLIQQRHKLIAPAMEPSAFFEMFCAMELLKDKDLDYEEIETGITGQSGDGGIDSIHAFQNGRYIHPESTDMEGQAGEIEIILIQAKRSSSFTESAVERLIGSARDIFDLRKGPKDLQKIYNLKLVEAIENFRSLYQKSLRFSATLNVRYYYVSTGSHVHPKVQRKVDILGQTIHEKLNDACFSFQFIGAAELLALSRKNPKRTLSIEYHGGCISTSDGSFIMLVELKHLYHFLKDDAGKLNVSIFDSNVRDYHGDSKVNKQISQSLKNGTNVDFWCLNNGITILSNKSSQACHQIFMEDPRIVNGLQTSYEIFHYMNSKEVRPDDTRKVLIRIIQQNDPENCDDIIRATNSQTTIPRSVLQNASKIQRDIEAYFNKHDLYYDRRKNYYKNQGRPKDRIVSTSYLAQALMSLLVGKPHYARANPAKFFENDNSYEKLFSHAYHLDLFLFAVLLMRKIEELLKDRLDGSSLGAKDQNNIKFYVAMATTYLSAGKTDDVSERELRFVVNSEKFDSHFEKALEIVSKVYEQLGASDKSAKSHDMTSRIVDLVKERFHRPRRQSENNLNVE